MKQVSIIYLVGKQELDDFADGNIPKLNSVSYDTLPTKINCSSELRL